MSFPNPLSKFKSKQPIEKEFFLSLLLDTRSVCAAAWQVGRNGQAEITAMASVEIIHDTWEDRLQAADRILTKLEETVKSTNLHKVIFGLPAAYLTESGDILKTIRPHIKKITTELSLDAMGFVPNFQAIVHMLKHAEGVPPSVILIGVSGTDATVSIYKVGLPVGHHQVHTEHIVPELERVLKSHAEMELLPSRILLYGINEARLESIKRELLRHPWQNKVNFMHFPKIELMPKDTGAKAVSQAGASELSTSMVDGPDDAIVPDQETVTNEPDIATDGIAEHVPPEEPELSDASDQPESQNTDEQLEDAGDTETVPEGTANVVMVDPETLGFKKHMTETYRTVATPLQKPQVAKGTMSESGNIEKKASVWSRLIAAKFRKSTPVPPEYEDDRDGDEGDDELQTGIRNKFPVGRLFVLFLLLIIFLGGVLGVFYWVLPKVEVTVLAIPKMIERSETVSIDQTATNADLSGKIIPGRTKEEILSGEKTVAVTGKKKVGTPAKGTVSIFNKSLTAKSLKKGQIISSGSLQFTLATDVSVASASENLVSGTVTFGKANAEIVASTIGTESNLPSGTEFNFKDISSSLLVARNDQALSGGTSKDITVVSRADQDALVKVLSQELLDQAKQGLSSKVGGSEKLIESTIKTSVTEKSFVQELDQETSELQGKVTVTVTGIAYSEDDGKTLLQQALSSDIPTGYSLVEGRTSIDVSSATVKKDGSITVSMNGKAVALPDMDVQAMQRNLAGKSVSDAQTYLKSVSGVGGVTFTFRRSPFTNRLPSNANNISVAVAVQE